MNVTDVDTLWANFKNAFLSDKNITESDTLNNDYLNALADGIAQIATEINNPNNTHYPPTQIP